MVFIGHGSPMNAIEDNPWSRGWTALGASLPTPRAIVCVSAHWYVRGTYVTDNEAPETIYDFGGFPPELSRVTYPAPGDRVLANTVAAVLSSVRAAPRGDWGLDHGAWSVLLRLRPAADVPVVQVSLDRGAPPSAHLAMGQALGSLRGQGVLILASGNVTHNLHHALRGGGTLPPWASGFDADIARAIEQRDHAFLIGALETEAGRHAHPSPDHYLPLLWAVGAAGDSAATFPITGFALGSLSMRAVLWR